MANSDGKFRHESLQDQKTVKALLEALTKGIRKGELTLSDGDDELTLPLDKLMTLRIKANRAGGKCEVDLRLTWTEKQDGPAKSSAPVIK